jgi:methyl-accepting chemotaxis protein
VRLGIRFRICGGTGILVALGLSLAGLAVGELATINHRFAALAVQSDNHARAQEVERLLEITGRSALAFWLSGDSTLLKQGSDADAQAEALLKQAIDAFPPGEERDAQKAIVSGLDEFRRTRNVLAIMASEVADLRHELADDGERLARQTSQLADAVTATSDARLMGAAWSVESSVLLARADAWRFFAEPGVERQAAFKTSAAKAIDSVGHLQDVDLSDELQSLVSQVGATLASYAASFDQISAELLKQQDLFDRQMRQQMDHLLGLVRQSAETQRRHLGETEQATDVLIAKTVVIQKSLAALEFVLGGFIALLVCRGIINPLKGMTGAMSKLAAGDIAVEIPSCDARDEVGAMAQAVEVFRQNAIARLELEAAQEQQRQLAAEERRLALTGMAETIEREAGQAVADVCHRTATMAATADAMAGSAARTGAAAESAASGATQALATAQTVASAADRLATLVDRVGDRVRQSTEVVSRALGAGRTMRATIEALNERVALIGEVADMIGEIADKTNLLALNATIEAARAGAAGKGFAVVANEVKQLAAQTARSTQQIGRHLAEVRDATGASVAAVGQIEQTIDEVNTIADSIAKAVEQQGAATTEIARNVAESAAAANHMARQIDGVSGEADKTDRHARELNDNITALNAAVTALDKTVIKVVRTSTDEVDRRHHPRRDVDLPCRLVVSDQSSHGARLADLSERGACVRGGPSLEIGARGALHIERLDTPLAFAVRSNEDGALHIEFETDDSIAVLLRPLLDALPQRTAA